MIIKLNIQKNYNPYYKFQFKTYYGTVLNSKTLIQL